MVKKKVPKRKSKKARPKQPIGKRMPKPLRRPSFAQVKSKIPKKAFSFKKLKGWYYCDIRPTDVHAIGLEMSGYPHLILFDGRSQARVALRFQPSKQGPLQILSIHRERTFDSYGETREGIVYDAKVETAAAKKFQKTLNGFNPAEFVLSEFLMMYAKQIKQGRPVTLRITEDPFQVKLYRPIIARFFDEKPAEKNGKLEYSLSLKKVRVKAALGIRN